MVGRTSPPLWDPGLTWPLLGLKSGEPWFPLLVMAFSSEPGAIPESQQRTGRGQAGTGSKSTAALVWKRWVRTWWSSDVSIIIRNSSHQAVFVLNCHLPHQDCPCLASLFVDTLRIRLGHPDAWRWCSDINIIVSNNFCPAVFALNWHLPCLTLSFNFPLYPCAVTKMWQSQMT